MTPNNNTSSPELDSLECLLAATKDADPRNIAIIKFVSVVHLLTANDAHSQSIDPNIKTDLLLTAIKMLDAACMASVCYALLKGNKAGKDIRVGAAVFALKSLENMHTHSDHISNMAMLFADPNDPEQVAATTGPRPTMNDLQDIISGLKTGKPLADVVSEIAEAPPAS